MRQDPGCLIGGKEPSISALIDYDGSCGKPVQRIPFDELKARIGELILNKEKPIVVDCHHGGRSEKKTLSAGKRLAARRES